MHIGMKYNQALHDVLGNLKINWQHNAQDVIENILSLHMRFFFLMIFRSLDLYALFNVPCYKDYTVHVMVIMFCYKTCYCLLKRGVYLKAFLHP